MPKMLHGGVSFYGACLFAMAIALYTNTPATRAGELQLRRA